MASMRVSLVRVSHAFFGNITYRLLGVRNEPHVLEIAGIDLAPCTDSLFRAFLLRCRPDIAMHHATHKRPLSCLAQVTSEVMDLSESLDIPPTLYLSGCVTEFLVVTRQFQELSEARNEYLTNGCKADGAVYASAECSSVVTAFRSPLASILDPGGLLVDYHTNSQNAGAAAMYKSKTTRMVCLFRIHTMLWRHRQNVTQTDEYMDRVVQEVQRNGLASSKSLDALSWVLVWLCMSDSDSGQANNEMGWRGLTRMVQRLMRVALRLNPQSWRSLENAMFEGLAGKRLQCDADSARNRGVYPWPGSEEVWEDFMTKWTI